MKKLTDLQAETVENVLTVWVQDQNEILGDAFNYGLDRAAVIEQVTAMINVSIILEHVLGVKGAKKAYAPSWDDVNDILEGLDS